MPLFPSILLSLLCPKISTCCLGLQIRQCLTDTYKLPGGDSYWLGHKSYVCTRRLHIGSAQVPRTYGILVVPLGLSRRTTWWNKWGISLSQKGVLLSGTRYRNTPSRGVHRTRRSSLLVLEIVTSSTVSNIQCPVAVMEKKNLRGWCPLVVQRESLLYVSVGAWVWNVLRSTPWAHRRRKIWPNVQIVQKCRWNVDAGLCPMASGAKKNCMFCLPFVIGQAWIFTLIRAHVHRENASCDTVPVFHQVLQNDSRGSSWSVRSVECSMSTLCLMLCKLPCTKSSTQFRFPESKQNSLPLYTGLRKAYTLPLLLCHVP